MTSALLELLKKKKQSMTANRRAKTVKPTDGTSRFRILPGWDAKNPAFYHDFGQHFIKDSTGELKAIYMCVDKTYGKPCSICDAISKGINASSDDAMIELLKEARSTGRVLMNALHVNGENPSEPVILEVAPTVFEAIIGLIQEWGAEVIDLERGMDIIIERNGKGKLTKYAVQIASKSAKVDPAIMKKITNLDEYVAQESEENATRALTNLAAISGYLSSPTRPSLPAHVASLRDISLDSAEDVTEVDTDDEALRELEKASVAETVAVAPAAAVKAPAVKELVKVAKAVAVSTGDAELDGLLADLGG